MVTTASHRPGHVQHPSCATQHPAPGTLQPATPVAAELVVRPAAHPRTARQQHHSGLGYARPEGVARARVCAHRHQQARCSMASRLRHMRGAPQGLLPCRCMCLILHMHKRDAGALLPLAWNSWDKAVPAARQPAFQAHPSPLPAPTEGTNQGRQYMYFDMQIASTIACKCM